jgi:hypothetical protein
MDMIWIRIIQRLSDYCRGHEFTFTETEMSLALGPRCDAETGNYAVRMLVCLFSQWVTDCRRILMRIFVGFRNIDGSAVQSAWIAGTKSCYVYIGFRARQMQVDVSFLFAFKAVACAIANLNGSCPRMLRLQTNGSVLYCTFPGKDMLTNYLRVAAPV